MAPIPTSQKIAIEILRRRFRVSVKSDAPAAKVARRCGPRGGGLFSQMLNNRFTIHAPKRAPQGCYLRPYSSAGNFFKSASRR